MDKAYSPQSVEENIYRMWESGGYFTPKIDKKKKPYTILLPLPNANDPMHMGHAMFTVQDILIRYHRMCGDPTLWLPGGDHAGIETQYVFEKKLAKEGKSRFQFDRDTLYNMIAEYVDQNRNINRDQMKRLGFSLDWTRYHYSLEPKIVAIVLDTFKKMHEDGLAYRDCRLVNYCTKDGTGFSDLEAVDKEIDGTLYYIKYPIQDGGSITVATTRPETLFGDVAVMVHPKDARFKSLREKTAVLPLIHRFIPIITDDHVDMKFGTGAVKVTPAHDVNDYEVGKNNNLSYQPVISVSGRMINTGIPDIDGLKVLPAREEVVKRLSNLGLLEKEVAHHTIVKTCYRCGSILEPLPIPQWYVKTKPLAKPAIEAVKKGKTKIFPKKRFEKMYFDWMNNILDWNISRQIVWGPRIPVWYCLDCNPDISIHFINGLGEKIFGDYENITNKNAGRHYDFQSIKKGLQSLSAPLHATHQLTDGPCKKCGGTNILQETDTFDTWFLSSQWPITTLGFPDDEDFKYFYPTSVLDTMWDILFFWVARMMMMGLYRTGRVPFEVIHLHSRVVDAHGQKMAKSRGNVLNPIELIDKYGADALRFALMFGAAPGSDIAVSEDKIRGMRNFANKLWNIGRFTLMNLESANKEIPFYDTSMKLANTHDKQIISDLNKLITSVTKNIERYRFSDAVQSLYEFTWHIFADVYLEKNKERFKTGDIAALAVLRHVFLVILKLLHPFMPFVTEEIWSKMPRKSHAPLIISSWPV